MLDVVIALVPAMVMAAVFFRLYAVIVIGTCVVSCVFTEHLCNLIRKKPNTVDDLSAVVTGIILALSLPPAAPWWVCVIGSVFAITIAKMVFGGLGSNIFNPAMAARAFLTVSFAAIMTTWTIPATIDTQMPTVSAEQPTAITQATPLAWSKDAIKQNEGAHDINYQLYSALWGQVGGCLGETSALALLIGGIYLLIRKTINIHIPLAVLLSAAAIASIGYFIQPDTYISPLLHLTAGGMFICAFFIATDPVTAPLTAKGMWIFGAGVGALVMLIRIVGDYPEGVMFAVLIMNGFTPLIDRFCKPVPAGGKVNE
jgi:electron transport complex protein RnfD